MRSKWFVLHVFCWFSPACCGGLPNGPARPPLPPPRRPRLPPRPSLPPPPAVGNLRINVGSYPDNLDPQKASFVGEFNPPQTGL